MRSEASSYEGFILYLEDVPLPWHWCSLHEGQAHLTVVLLYLTAKNLILTSAQCALDNCQEPWALHWSVFQWRSYLASQIETFCAIRIINCDSWTSQRWMFLYPSKAWILQEPLPFFDKTIKRVANIGLVPQVYFADIFNCTTCGTIKFC